MNRRTTCWLVLLTALYLCFELAFNARLLDAAGNASSSEDIHNIEIYGRTLSGVAMALLCLGSGLKRRWPPLGISLACVVAGVMTYMSLETIVDGVVSWTSPSQRRAAMSLVLVQKAVASGTGELVGAPPARDLFERPPGKVFLALFPVMTLYVNELNLKIRAARVQLLERRIAEELGGINGYHAKYGAAVQKQHALYARQRQQAGIAAATPSEFVGRLDTQRALREDLRLPDDVTVLPNYNSAERRPEFQRLYARMLRHNAERQAHDYDAPVEQFAPGAALFDVGMEAARAVVAPAVALFCSLLGAMTHTGKLVMLLLHLRRRDSDAGAQLPAPRMSILLATMGALWLVLTAVENEVTQSSLYAYLQTSGIANVSPTNPWAGYIANNVVHVVSMGQSYGYPVNEFIRSRVLQGITFGYQPPRKEPARAP